MIENIYKFFEDNLNNVTATVSLGSVSLEGHREATCLLKVEHKFQGAYVYSGLKWNDLKIREIIRYTVAENDKFNYEDLALIMDEVVPILEKQWVRIGTIRPYGIKNITSSFGDKKLYSIHITYEDGSICKINNIKPYEKTI